MENDLYMTFTVQEYYGMPEKTQEEFFNDQGKRWFRTVSTSCRVLD